MNPVTAITGAIPSVVDSAFKGLDNLFTSDKERAEAKLKVIEELAKPHHYQALTNLEEAKHASIFVAGWRPAIGWVCAAGIAYAVLIYPFSGMIATFIDPSIQLPEIDSSILMTLTLNLLGLGGLRTYEKQKGIARESLPPLKKGNLY